MNAFKVGDWVIKLTPYHDSDLHTKPRKIEQYSKYQGSNWTAGLYINFQHTLVDGDIGWDSYEISYKGAHSDWKKVTFIKKHLVMSKLP